MTKLLKISKYRPSIFQGRLDFSTQGAVSLTLQHPLETHIRRALLIALACFACGYLYFVCASVLNVMAEREALSQIGKIGGAIGGEEQQYLVLSQAVTPETGGALGLSPVGKTQYVYRPGNVGAATIARNEI
jgi:hypothetical protein